MYTTKSEPYVNYGLWMIIMCQCWSNNYNKHTTLMPDVDGEGGCVCVWGVVVGGNSMYFVLNFVVSLKLLSKINCINFLKRKKPSVKKERI